MKIASIYVIISLQTIQIGKRGVKEVKRLSVRLINFALFLKSFSAQREQIGDHN